MREIPLRARDGSIRALAIVDDEDYEWLMQWRWHATVDDAGRMYARRSFNVGGRGNSKGVAMHRHITGLQPEERIEVDHRDGNGLNNVRSNLRLATRNQNAKNRKPRRDSRSGIRGVHYLKREGRWQGKVQVDGVSHYLGTFETKEEAATVTETFRREYMPYSREYDARRGA